MPPFLSPPPPAAAVDEDDHRQWLVTLARLRQEEVELLAWIVRLSVGQIAQGLDTGRQRAGLSTFLRLLLAAIHHRQMFFLGDAAVIVRISAGEAFAEALGQLRAAEFAILVHVHHLELTQATIDGRRRCLLRWGRGERQTEGEKEEAFVHGARPET